MNFVNQWENDSHSNWNSVTGSAPVDVDGLRLPDAVRAAHGLQVVHRQADQQPYCQVIPSAAMISWAHRHLQAHARGAAFGRLWHALHTCRSFCGFQSESKMMTVSAVARLMPSPPARVDSRNAKSVLPGALKCSIDCRKKFGYNKFLSSQIVAVT